MQPYAGFLHVTLSLPQSAVRFNSSVHPGEHDTLKVEMLNHDGPEATSLPASSPAQGFGAAQIPRKVLLVPFVRSIVPEVNVAGGFLTIDPPDGLLDLAAVPKQPKGKKLPALGSIRPNKQASSGMQHAGDTMHSQHLTASTGAKIL